MLLGDYFPAAAREAANEQRLVPGAVLYLPMTFRDGRTKEKYMVVVAAVEPNLLLLVINTEVNQFIIDRPTLNRCQIVVPQEDNTFLDYDSFLACHEIFPVDATAVSSDLASDMSRYRGEISEQLKQQILGVIATRPATISKSHRDAITAAFT